MNSICLNLRTVPWDNLDWNPSLQVSELHCVEPNTNVLAYLPPSKSPHLWQTNHPPISHISSSYTRDLRTLSPLRRQPLALKVNKWNPNICSSPDKSGISQTLWLNGLKTSNLPRYLSLLPHIFNNPITIAPTIRFFTDWCSIIWMVEILFALNGYIKI